MVEPVAMTCEPLRLNFPQDFLPERILLSRLLAFAAEGGVGDKMQISDSVKSLVTISHLNLFDQARIALLGKMDIVFCRNVIIYFDLDGKKKVIDSFFQRLHPEGYLLLGHSESLINLSTSFQLRHFQHDMVYQKPTPSSAGGGL